MNDDHDFDLAARRRRGRLVAAPALAALAGLLVWQMFGRTAPALAAAVGAAIPTFALWGGLVVRPEGVSFGRAAGIGIAATFAAFFAVAIAGVATSRLMLDGETATIAVFATMVMLPVMVATAVGLAAIGRLASRR